MPAADIASGSPRGLSPSDPIVTDFYTATVRAEDQGKRLPTAPEFQRILDVADLNGGSRLVGLFTEPWEWSSTSMTATLPTNEGFVGPVDSGSLAFIYGGAPSKAGRSLGKVFEGDNRAAVRGVRSVRPRLTAADFLALEMEPESMVDAPPPTADH